jgi:hypothetical protein
MAAEIDNLVLEHLKRFQSGQERIERRLDALTQRAAALESGQATVLLWLADLVASGARLQERMDAFGTRLERIERRLELA